MTIFCYVFAGLGLNDGLRRAMENAGVNGSSTICDHIAHYMMQSKSNNTVKKYYYYFRRWNSFCMQHHYSVIPAEPIHIVLYITKLLDSGASANVISTTIFALKWAHSLRGLSDPTDNGFVKNLVESAKRLRSSKTVKKDAVTSEMLIELCDRFSGATDLLLLRDLSMILVGFAGFLRFDELVELTCKDVKFHDGYLSVQIRKSKTDIYRSGSEILINKGVTSACPYSMLLKYSEMAGLNKFSDEYLFRPIVRSRDSCKLIKKNKKLSYTRTREIVIGKLKLVAPNLNIGVHSLRSGGASTAANADVNDRCLKRHGRWKADVSKDGYIEDSVQKRLKITEALKL